MDTGSAVSLLLSTFDFERYYGPQDLLAVNHTQLIVQGLKTLNVHLGFAQSYPWTFRVANVPYGILGCDFLSCHGFHVDVKNRCLIDPEGSMFNDSTSLDPDSTIESLVIQIESPLDCERKLLAFAPSTLHTRVDDITEPKLCFELKPTDIGQNVTEPKLDSKPCDQQSADLASPSLMNVLHSDTDSSSDFEVNRVTSQRGNETEKAHNTQSAEPSLFETLAADYQEVFQSSINTRNIKHAIEHHIVTNGPPVKAKVRRLSPEKLAFVEQEIEQLLDDNILVPSSSYASPIHIVAKRQPDKFRNVGDYRELNNVTQPDRYLLPFLHDFSDKLQGCTVFSKLDCLKGYHQIPIAEEDAHKTAIITPIGLYQYNMMPFGLRNSGNSYQRYMDQVTRGLNFCFAYVDDVLIASHSLEEHQHHLRLILDRFKTFGVILNKDKCKFAVSHLTFLGHHISAEGFTPIQQKVHTIQNFPQPKTMKQLISPLNSLANCDIKKGSCIIGNRVHIWKVPDKLDCPRVKQIRTVHNVTLHLDNFKNVYRAEIKKLGISLHSQTTSPRSVFNCFPKNSVCDPTGIILIPRNCLKLHRLRLIKSFPSKSKLPYLRFLTESNDLLEETISQLNSELHYQECQLQSLFTSLYSLLGRQYPGQVLSSLLHKPAAGITVGNVITEIACKDTNVTLLLCLQHGKHFSSRPLVSLDGLDDTNRIGQVLRDGNVYMGVRLIEKFLPGRVLTFLIQGKFYTFQNYTLSHSDSSIYPLSPTLAPVNTRYDAIDFQTLTHFFPSSNLGFEDVNSLLQTISETEMIQDQLTNLFQQTDTSSTSYEPSHILDTTNSALKSVFLQMLSSITNPILNFVFTVIFILSLVGSVILTIWSL